jgi:hypothetical protein
MQLPGMIRSLPSRLGSCLPAQALLDFGRLLVQHSRPLVRSQLPALGQDDPLPRPRSAGQGIVLAAACHRVTSAPPLAQLDASSRA